MKNFLAALVIFIVFFAGGIMVAERLLKAGQVDSVTWTIFLYFVMLTLFFHFGLLRASAGRPQAFVRFYMASTTIKLLLHIGVILLYCLFHREDAVRFIITFLVMYILFTTFEVTVVWKQFVKK